MSAVFIISAPSGSGKSTLVGRLLNDVGDLMFSVSYTTRARRGNEREGGHYHYISKEDFETRLQTLRSDVSDAEKFESVFGYGRERGDEGLGRIFADTTIDPLTGKLLGRFIAEERDTRRRLEAQYERVKATSVDDAGLAQISERLERLAKTIEELKVLRQKRR